MNASVLRTKQFYRYALEECSPMTCRYDVGSAWGSYSIGKTRNGTDVPCNSVIIRCDEHYTLIKE